MGVLELSLVIVTVCILGCVIGILFDLDWLAAVSWLLAMFTILLTLLGVVVYAGFMALTGTS